jgi:hypothetical protein
LCTFAIAPSAIKFHVFLCFCSRRPMTEKPSGGGSEKEPLQLSLKYRQRESCPENEGNWPCSIHILQFLHFSTNFLDHGLKLRLLLIDIGCERMVLKIDTIRGQRSKCPLSRTRTSSSAPAGTRVNSCAQKWSQTTSFDALNTVALIACVGTSFRLAAPAVAFLNFH